MYIPENFIEIIKKSEKTPASVKELNDYCFYMMKFVSIQIINNIIPIIDIQKIFLEHGIDINILSNQQSSKLKTNISILTIIDFLLNISEYEKNNFDDKIIIKKLIGKLFNKKFDIDYLLKSPFDDCISLK
jgi:hypothetical protein